MFSNKGIKTFCNVVASIILVLSVFAVVLGMVFLLLNLVDPRIGFIVPLALIGGGLASAISAIISLYPLYAMADMSEKLESIEKKIGQLESSDNYIVNYVEKTEDLFRSNRGDKEEYRKRGAEVSPQDIFEFINNRYEINLCLDDSCEELKAKIESIEGTSPKTLRLIKKVSEAKSTIEIISVLRMHKAANS